VLVMFAALVLNRDDLAVPLSEGVVYLIH